MADERSLSFGVQFRTDSAPMDELNEKQRQAQKEAEETAEKLEEIGTSLTDIGNKAASSFSSVEGASNDMGTTVRSAMLQSITSGDQLGKTLRIGIGAAVDNVKAKFKGFGTAAKSAVRGVGDAVRHPVQAIKATLGSALNKAKAEAAGLGTQAKTTGDSLEDMTKRGRASGDGLVGTLKKLAVAMAGLTVIKKAAGAVKEFMATAIEAGASAEEMQSKFDTVFKSASDGANNWADSFSKAAHRSKTEVMGFMADSGAIFSGLGMGSEDAAQMSEQMTSLSYDLASFNNLADEDAFAKLRSGIMGETEGLKSMGIVLNETALEQSMMNMGLKGSFQELDEATKVQVRFNAILAQTSDAQGDVTRTSGSYTNSLKGLRGVWSDFLAKAGAKFTPVLNQMFNVIIEAWPKIEPALMQLVDLLSQGLSQAVPIFLELGSQLLPVFCQALGQIFTAIQPLIPVFGNLVSVLLPPLAQIIGMICSQLLPPLMDIMNIIIQDILMPLMPIIMSIVQSLLPPLASLLQAIAPLLQAIAPVLQFIGQIIKIIADAIAMVVGWIADGVGAIGNFFSGLFGGAEQAAGGMEDLASSADNATSAIADAGTIPMPQVEIPDTSGYTSTVQTAMDTAPIMAEESWGAAKETASSGLAEIGTATSDTYGTMAAQAEEAWNRMGTAAESAVTVTIAQLQRLKAATDQIGAIQIITGGGGNSKGIPHNADGTDDFPGGPTYINEEGGEIAVLPSGSKVIPADKSEAIVNSSRHSKRFLFAPQISVVMSGTPSTEEQQRTKEWFKQMCREAYEEMQDEDSREEALEESFA